MKSTYRILLAIILITILALVVNNFFVKPLLIQSEAKSEFIEGLPLAVAPAVTQEVSPTVIENNIVIDDYLLEIPSIDFSWLVHHITEEETTDEPWGIPKKLLDKYSVTDSPYFGFPDNDGMVAIAGHRDVYGSPFWSIDKVENGDLITITPKKGKVIEYKVYNITINDASDQAYLTTVYPHELRIVSCLIGSTKKRIFIYAYQKEQ